MSRGRGRDYDPVFKLKVVARLDGGTNVSELTPFLPMYCM